MAKILYFPKKEESPINKSDKITYGQDDLLLDLETIALHLNNPVSPFKKPEDYAFLRQPYLTIIYSFWI